jgi:hypothetical protein
MPEVIFNKQDWTGESMTVDYTAIENGFTWKQFDYQFTLQFDPFIEDWADPNNPEHGVWFLRGDSWQEPLHRFFVLREEMPDIAMGDFIVWKACVWICNHV